MFILLFLALSSAARLTSVKKPKPQIIEIEDWDTGEVAWDIPSLVLDEKWIESPKKTTPTPIESKYNQLSRRMMDSLTLQAITSGIENGMSTELLKMQSIASDFNEFITHFYDEMSETDWILLVVASFIGFKYHSISAKKEKKIERQSSADQTERYLKMKKRVTLVCIVILSIFTKNVKSVI